jgi:hypothetical protein
VSDTIITVSDRKTWLFGAALLFFMAISFSAGMAYQSAKHRLPYEVNVTGGGVVMLIPPGWGHAAISNPAFLRGFNMGNGKLEI